MLLGGAAGRRIQTWRERRKKKMNDKIKLVGTLAEGED